MEAGVMKSIGTIALAAFLLVGLVQVTRAADETTLSGTLMCAKCALKKADASKCQDVLVVKDTAGATTEYYIAKNDAAEKAGHQCKSEAKATVTGVVSEKDGKKWIEASKIEKT
jgi:hypothetical protein